MTGSPTPREVINIACYKPKIRIEDLHAWKKAKDGHLYHPARIITTEQLNSKELGEYSDYKVQIIPCQTGCIGCRLDNSRNWANRGYLESLYHKNKNWFITLTYDDDHLPKPKNGRVITKDGTIYEDDGTWNGILDPKDAERFLNTFRKIFEREFKHRDIKFMCAGEYGEKNRRPHYHFIIFNAPLPADSFFNPRPDWKKDVYFQNKIVERAWGGPRQLEDGSINPKSLGISNICEANWNNIAYVARYITKKMNGPESEDWYAIQGEIKEFFRVSTNPGIGRQYYEDHWQEIYENDSVLIKNNSGSRWEKPPKYYDKLLEKDQPEIWEKVKKTRQKKAQDSLDIKLSNTSVSWYEQLQIELRSKEQKAKTLRRNGNDQIGHI